MRTTLTLDDDALALARELARRRGITVGKAVSELVRRGGSRPLATRDRAGLQVLELPDGSPPVAAEHVDRLMEELP